MLITRHRAWPCSADDRYVTYGIIARRPVGRRSPNCMILYLTGLKQMSRRDQIEAARLDGARGWRMLWHVFFFLFSDSCRSFARQPSSAWSSPVIGAVRSFDLVSIMTDGRPLRL